MNSFARRLLASSAAGVALAPIAVAAQTTGNAPSPLPTADTVASGTGELKDIIVTARRREETLQQTPVAITAITPVQFESKAAVNLGDLQGAAPNVLITPNNSGAASANVSIRGLTFQDIEKSFDPTVGVVVDGVFIGTATGQFFDFFDIAQIEVLRGPQGTLYGRNTIGGVISIRRTRPTGEWGGKLQASFGNYDTWATRAVLNAPIVDGVLAAKAFYFHNQSDGWYRNAITGRRNGFSNNENFGLSLLFTPSSNFNALLTLEKQVQDFQPALGSLTSSAELFCAFIPARECNRNNRDDLYTVFQEPAHGHYEAPAATLEMNFDTGPIKLTSITGYRESDEDQTMDFDASSSDLYYTRRTQKFHQVSQELRAAGGIGERFDYVVGGYFYDAKYNLVQLTRLFGGPAPTQDITGTSQSYAVFADVNVKLTDTVRLNVGGRWTHDKKTSLNFVDPNQFPKGRFSGSKFTPKVTLDYRPSQALMIYGTYSRGYRAGGLSGRGQTLISSTTPYSAETVDSYELGLKSEWLDRRLIFNIAGFYADYRGLQQPTIIPLQGGIGNETIIANIGKAKIKGIEVEITAKPVRGLTLTGSLGLLRNKVRGFFTQAPVNGVLTTFDYSAIDLLYNPRETLSFTGEYVVPVGAHDLTFNASYRNIAPYLINTSTGQVRVVNGINVVETADPRMRTDRQNLLDGSASVTFDLGGNKARVTGYVRNVLDDRGATHGAIVANLWAFGSGREPRTYGVQLGYEF